MRRISLALALVGAVAATGCGGGAKKSSDSGAAPGVKDGTFTVTIQNGQGQTRNTETGVLPLEILGGKVTSVPAGIDCGVGATTNVCAFDFPIGTTVVLTATGSGLASPDKDANGNVLTYKFIGWSGDCSGLSTCSLSGNADKYVVASFGGGAGVHPNWSGKHPTVAIAGGVASGTESNVTFNCYDCHQMTQAQGIIPACGSCHSHFNATNAAWTDHNTGWGQACQRCHTTEGFRDYMGVDGSADYLAGTFLSTNTLTSTTAKCTAAGTCDPAAYKYGPLACDACHTATPPALVVTATKVMLASSATTQLTVDNTTGICAQCHQGRESTTSINAIVGATSATPDAVIPGTSFSNGKNGFVNPHYLGAAGTLFGGDAQMWAQYAGNVYTGRNAHGGAASCTSCHSPHTGKLPNDSEIKAKCGGCHVDEVSGLPVTNFMQLEESRQFGFEGDVDGDGVVESVKAEIDGVAAQMYKALQAYGVAAAKPIKYTDGYPYFMNDTTTGGSYASFTTRSLRAAFNYKWYKAEPGAWAHNPRYVVEVLFDTLNDLNDGISALGGTPPAYTAKRAFNGHFGAAEDPSQYSAMVYHATFGTSDTVGAMGFTSAACYQCHGGDVGFTTYLAGAPAAIGSIPTGGKVTAMQCSTCHKLDGVDMKGLRTDVTAVYFPPQKNNAGGQVSFAVADLPTSFAVCGTCHSARENKASVDAMGLTSGAFTATLKNPHYLGAAATVMGTRAKSWYEYDGKAYVDFPAFWKSGTNGNAPGPHGSPHGADCAGCHQPKQTKHEFGVDYTYCAGCHQGAYALAPKEEEYVSMKAELLAAIDAYVNNAANTAAFTTANPGATGVCYDGATYGYVLVKTSAGCSATAAKLDLNSQKAAYNLHWMNKDPGGWAHNEYYVMQLVYDSIVDLGGTPSFTVLAKTVTDRTVTPPVTSPDTTSPNCLQNRPTTCAP